MKSDPFERDVTQPLHEIGQILDGGSRGHHGGFLAFRGTSMQPPAILTRDDLAGKTSWWPNHGHLLSAIPFEPSDPLA